MDDPWRLVMEQEEQERVRDKVEQAVRRRLEGAPIERVEVLRYGDAPEIERGEVFVRVIISAPENATDKKERERALESFHDGYREAIRELGDGLQRNAMSATLEFQVAGQPDDADEPHGPVIKLKRGMGPGLLAGADPSLTPVMARLGREELETLDTLIAVGIAGSRSEAVRWALTRIRERPAYAQILAHSREIDQLKSQF
jgi:hypothetical protein